MPVINKTAINENSDVTTTTTMLHEVLPITGAILSGTYVAGGVETNIKNYSHGMFQSVYDYPYLSSSANHIVDLTIGYDETSAYNNAGSVQNSKKTNLYNQFAQLLLGYTSSTSDSIRKFESDLSLDGVNTMNEVFFITFSRLLTKDQIKRNSFSIEFGTGATPNPFSATTTLTDASASYGSDGGVAPSVGGDYGVLYDATNNAHGILFYQAGMAVVSSSVFTGVADFDGSGRSVEEVMSGSAITASCDGLRFRTQNLSFNNTTEINSTIYFCRVPHNQYNYSSNPTYLSGSKLRVKNQETDNPVSYITTVGLYNSANELLAVAKLSEPLRKDPTQDITIRVRTDF